MFSNNPFLLVKILFVLSITIVLFGVGQKVLAQTQSCTSPVSGNPVSSDTQFVADAKTACTDAGRTDTDACVAEMRSNFCASSQTPSTSNNNSNIGAGVMGLTFPVAGMAIKVILYIVNVLVGVLISFAGFLTGWALEFNLSILDFSPSFIMTGWTIFRDIANLGFVLGIIIIAIATILRYKDYTAKQILWKLIVAALIVNFSLVIAGAFITASNSVSQYLLNAMGSNDGSTVAKIGDSFGYTKLVTEVSDWGSGWTGVVQGIANTAGVGDGASLGVIVSLAIILLFGVVFLFTLLAYAGMLVLRYFSLVFLLIISPVVWLLWIFPSTKKYFGEWWSKFLHWIQYAPFMLVFTYISLTILQAWGSYQSVIEGKLGSNYALFGVIGGNTQSQNLHFGTIMVALVACAMLLGGLKMAQKMGYGGTKMVLGGWDKATGRTKRWAQSRAKWMGSRTGDKLVGKKSLIGRNVQKGLVGVGGYKPKTKLGKAAYAVFGGYAVKNVASEAAQGLAIGQAKMEKGSQKLSGDYKKNLDQLSADQLIQLLPTLNTNEQTTALNILASKDKMGDVDITTNNKNREIVLNTMRNMNKIGMGKEKGALEKKIGASEDMLAAWDNGGKDGKFVKKLTKKDGSPDVDENTGKQKEETITFSSAADKFYQKFGKEDYKNFAKNYGDILEKIDKLTNEQEDFLKPFFNKIATTDMGTGLGSFSSALKNEEQRKGFYTQLVREVSTQLNPLYKIQLNPLVNITKPDGSVSPRKVSPGDFDEIVDTLNNSGNSTAKKLADKIKKSISAQLTGYEDEEKEENKGEEKSKSDEGKPKS